MKTKTLTRGNFEIEILDGTESYYGRLVLSEKQEIAYVDDGYNGVPGLREAIKATEDHLVEGRYPISHVAAVSPSGRLIAKL